MLMQNRREFLTTLSLAGAAGLVRAPQSLAAEDALETTTVRLAKYPVICLAPVYVGEELLRAEGFTDIRFVDVITDRQQIKASGVCGQCSDKSVSTAEVIRRG